MILLIPLRFLLSSNPLQEACWESSTCRHTLGILPGGSSHRDPPSPAEASLVQKSSFLHRLIGLYLYCAALTLIYSIKGSPSPPATTAGPSVGSFQSNVASKCIYYSVERRERSLHGACLVRPAPLCTRLHCTALHCTALHCCV
jgi:hypothetical protein